MNSAQQYCEEKTAKSGSSFYYSFLGLPPEQRQAITAVYAFCRVVDDIVDECSDSDIAAHKLNWWCIELDRIFSNQAQHPIGIALHTAIHRFDLPKYLFEQILSGMHQDLHFQGYTQLDALIAYCYQVASAPGLLAARIFGFEDPKTLEYAKKLGLSFQWVNMIRDIGEDATRGRIYFPRVELDEYAVKAEDILERRYTLPFKHFMAFQAERARSYYQEALDLLPAIDRKKQRPGLIMAAIYFDLLRLIEKNDFRVLAQKIQLTPLRKWWLYWKNR